MRLRTVFDIYNTTNRTYTASDPPSDQWWRGHQGDRYRQTWMITVFTSVKFIYYQIYGLNFQVYKPANEASKPQQLHRSQTRKAPNKNPHKFIQYAIQHPTRCPRYHPRSSEQRLRYTFPDQRHAFLHPWPTDKQLMPNPPNSGHRSRRPGHLCQ